MGIRLEAERKAAVGDRVHYVVGRGGIATGCAAATVTEKDGDRVGLRVTPPDGSTVMRPLSSGGCPYDGGPDVDVPDEELTGVDWSCDGWPHAPGTWHWIARDA